jgi:predicted ATPase/DNA-binding XRE family transcriptional regulator
VSIYNAHEPEVPATTETAARTFGDLLRTYRHRASLSQEELAERAQISAAAVGALERGVRRAPYRSTVALLATALHLSEDDAAALESARRHARAASGTRDDGERLDALRTLPNNLPVPISSFVGRELDVAVVEELIRAHRMVTLVGAGGVGKTRVALQVAGNMLDGAGHGVWFVDFAAVKDAVDVESTIVGALRAPDSAGRAPAETVIAFLKDRTVLLVLDNCEHLVGPIATIVAHILSACRSIHVLATSREPLLIGGEHTYRIPSLTVPPEDLARTLSPDRALEYGAISLFAARANAANAQFKLTKRLVPIVSDVCRRLDGIPLAIELAAARVNVFSVSELGSKLHDRFLVLTGGSRTALPRHRTMRAVLDWSYDMLSDAQQRALRLLSLFVGGFSLELASRVAASTDGWTESDVIELVTGLVDRSLIQADVHDEIARYRLLESTRDYAGEKLAALGERSAAQRAHAEALVAIGDRFAASSRVVSDREWDTLVKPEVDNWRVALDWAFGPDGDALIGQRLAGHLCATWFGQDSADAARSLRTALRTCNDSTPSLVRARLEFANSRFDWWRGSGTLTTIKESAQRAIELFEEAGDDLGARYARIHEARTRLLLAGESGDVEAEQLVHDLCEVASARRESRPTFNCLTTLGVARFLAADASAARRYFQEALTLLKAEGSEHQAAAVAQSLAEAEFREGDATAAARTMREALPHVRAAGNWYHIVNAVSTYSSYLIALKRFDEARDYSREVLRLSIDRTFHWFAYALQHLAAVGALAPCDDAGLRRERICCSARLLGFSTSRLAYRATAYTEKQEREMLVAALRDTLGVDADVLMSEGARWSEEHAIAEALTL